MVRADSINLPDVSVSQLGVLVFSILVNRRNENAAGIDDSPFCDTMPMKFAYCTFLQVLLGGSNVCTRRKIGNDLLSDPSSIEKSGMRV
jgi:hypothetical protein